MRIPSHITSIQLVFWSSSLSLDIVLVDLHVLSSILTAITSMVAFSSTIIVLISTDVTIIIVRRITQTVID
ncbi:hypothetical protein LZ30DRAFT_732737 [Colletotrichum cereale]|nr:hypothetical protein LZ30DRAFT_732737 [Colletotrichum cereale]